MPRPKGAINRPKRALLKLLQEKYPGYEPVIEMTKAALALTDNAMASGDTNDWSAASNAHDKVAQYTTPKLKAIEVTGEDGGPLNMKIGWDDGPGGHDPV